MPFVDCCFVRSVIALCWLLDKDKSLSIMSDVLKLFESVFHLIFDCVTLEDFKRSNISVYKMKSGW